MLVDSVHPYIGIGIEIHFTIGATVTLRFVLANRDVEPVTGLYLPVGNKYLSFIY